MIWISFLFLTQLLGLRLPVLCWSEVARVENFVLYLILEEILFSFLSLSMLLAGLSYMAFIMLSHIPSISNYLRVFVLTRYWILSIAFYVYIAMIIRFSFHSISVMNHIYWFVYAETSLCPEDKSNLIMVYNILMCCILWGFLHLYSLRILAYNFLSL